MEFRFHFNLNSVVGVSYTNRILCKFTMKFVEGGTFVPCQYYPNNEIYWKWINRKETIIISSCLFYLFPLQVDGPDLIFIVTWFTTPPPKNYCTERQTKTDFYSIKHTKQNESTDIESRAHKNKNVFVISITYIIPTSQLNP